MIRETHSCNLFLCFVLLLGLPVLGNPQDNNYNRQPSATVVETFSGRLLGTSTEATCTGFDPLDICVNQPLSITITAFCGGSDVIGAEVPVSSSDPAVLSVTPPVDYTPAEFSLECLSGGTSTVTYGFSFDCGGPVSFECDQQVTCNQGCPQSEQSLDGSTRCQETADHIGFDTSEYPFASRDEVRQIEQYMKQDASNRLSFDVVRARADGFSKLMIALGQMIVRENNKLVEAAIAGRSILEDGLVSDQLVDRLTPYFLHLQQTDPCGTRRDPTPCPPWLCTDGDYFLSFPDVVEHLTSNGYHRTADYAGGSDRDYTDPIEDHACGQDTFRSHARTREFAALCWGFFYQESEPNPEIFSYAWPRPLRGLYVRWYHLRFC